MNRILADTLSALNGIAALVIIAAGAIFGYASIGAATDRWIGTILGGLLGLLIAAVLCGTIAFLALIEGHLRNLSGDVGKPSFRRSEPTL